MRLMGPAWKTEKANIRALSCHEPRVAGGAAAGRARLTHRLQHLGTDWAWEGRAEASSRGPRRHIQKSGQVLMMGQGGLHRLVSKGWYH